MLNKNMVHFEHELLIKNTQIEPKEDCSHQTKEGKYIAKTMLFSPSGMFMYTDKEIGMIILIC